MQEPTAVNEAGANPTKEELEKRKLGLEIEDLRKPIYLKPSFYAVLGPTLLAFGSLVLGFYTGLFDVKNERIRAETALLDIQKATLLSDVGKLRAAVEVEQKQLADERLRISAQLKEEQARFQDETNKIKAKADDDIAAEGRKFDTERRKLAADFEAEKSKLAAQLVPLEQELASVAEQVEIKNRELATLRTEIENRKVVTLLEQMLGDDSLNPYNAASVSLIRLLKEDQSKSSILEARLLQDSKPVFIANLMYVLYQSTQNRIWLDKLFEFTETNARFPDVWGVFAEGTWSGSEEIEIMKFIVRTVSKLRLGHDAIGRAFHIFQLPKNRPEKAKSEFLTAEKVEFIRLGRNLALDIRANPVPKLYGILAAAFFAPEAYPVLASTILASENESEAAKDALREHIREVRSGIFEAQYSHLKQTLQRLDFPTDLPQGAARWKKTKLAQKWAALVLENNLEELVRQQSGDKQKSN